MSNRALAKVTCDPQAPSRQLALLTAANKVLAESPSFEEIKGVRDMTEALRVYAKSISLGIEKQNEAAAVRLRAERQAGAILAKMALRGGDRKSKSHRATLKLEDLQIDRDESARWQLEAAVPEADFEQYLADTTAAKKELTSAGLRRHAKKLGIAGARPGRKRAKTGPRAKPPKTKKPSPSIGDASCWATKVGDARAETASETILHLNQLIQMVDQLGSNRDTKWNMTECRYVARLRALIDRSLNELAT